MSPPIPAVRYDFGDIAVVDSNHDGIFNKGDVIEPSPHSPGPVDLNQKVSELKEKYQIDLKSGRNIRLNPAARYFSSSKVAELLVDQGDLVGAQMLFKAANHEARQARLGIQAAELKSQEKKSFLAGVEAHLARAESAARGGDLKSLEDSLQAAHQLNSELKKTYRTTVKIDEGRLNKINSDFVGHHFNEAKRIHEAGGLQRLDQHLKAAQDYAIAHDMGDLQADAAQIRRQAVDRIMEESKNCALQGDNPGAVVTELHAVQTYLDSHRLATGADLPKLEEIEKIAYLKAIQREERNSGLWHWNFGVRTEADGYADELGMSREKALLESYYLDAVNAAEIGDFRALKDAFSQIWDLAPIWDIVTGTTIGRMNEIHESALSRAADMELKKAEECLQTGERGGGDHISEARQILEKLSYEYGVDVRSGLKRAADLHRQLFPGSIDFYP